MRRDGDRVQCHLCGSWFKMVGGHHLLRKHGWTTEEYRDAFRLDRTTSTVAPDTAELKRSAMLDQYNNGERTGLPRQVA